MKAKARVPKTRPVRQAQETKPVNEAPLSRDKLIDLLTKADKSLSLEQALVSDTLPIILFLREAAITEEVMGSLRVRGEEGVYCDGGNAIDRILDLVASRMYAVHQQIETTSFGVQSAVDKYRRSQASAK